MCDHCGCHEYAPIGDLAKEHETILELAWRIAAAPTPDPAVVAALLAVLDPHVEKEELGLYPALLASGYPEVRSAAQLEDEPPDIREALPTRHHARAAYGEGVSRTGKTREGD